MSTIDGEMVKKHLIHFLIYSFTSSFEIRHSVFDI
jgi:hypothetical protein